jgi:hypothetical protein
MLSVQVDGCVGYIKSAMFFTRVLNHDVVLLGYLQTGKQSSSWKN